MEIRPHISITPGVCGGKPIVTGTRMRVIDILDMLAEGVTEQEILADFDYISVEAIRACVKYAAEAISLKTAKAAA